MSNFVQEDILGEILIRLPVKSMGRSRCVSKQWRSLLSSRRFIKAHLAFNAAVRNKILFRGYRSLYTSTIRPDGVVDNDLILISHAIPLNGSLVLAGSCNGLVLIIMEESCNLLINPTTLEYSRLPDFEVNLVYNTCIAYGFGYDSSTDDYKVVALNSGPNPVFQNTCAVIYSLKMKSWSRIGHNIGISIFRDCYTSLFINGALHWRIYTVGFIYEILALDVCSEKFYEIPCPGCVSEHTHWNNLIDYKGYLGIVAFDTEKCTKDVWIMKRYGKVESWTRITCINGGLSRAVNNVHQYWTNALFLVNTSRTELDFWSFNHEKCFRLKIDKGNKDDFNVDRLRFGGSFYSESLVSPLSLHDQA